MSSHLTNMGIPGIGAIPYGLHVCHFYPSREELLVSLIPYFQAGLTNNEKCLWIASDPLPADTVISEVAKYSDLQNGVTSGQLVIYNAADWYGDPSTLNAEAIIARWQEQEGIALSEGYRGLRVTGNTSFVPRENWVVLMDYERKLSKALQGRRIVVCCSYHRLTCEPVDVLEVIQSHDAALDRSDNNWQVYLQQAYNYGPSRREGLPESQASNRQST